MYVVIVVLLLAVLPIGSIAAEHIYFHSPEPLFDLAGKWFTFWAVGGRLFLAGLRQTIQPAFTARQIFGIASDEAFPVVRELGLANLAMGALGLLSLTLPQARMAAAFVGGLYYGLAGLLHLFRGEKNATERFAMITDLMVFVLLAGYAGLVIAANYGIDIRL